MVIVIEIEDRSTAKPFLGGWRNVLTNKEYHNAGTQTSPKSSSGEFNDTRSRQTQAVLQVERGTEVHRDSSTQTCEQPLLVPSLRDGLIAPGRFRPGKPAIRQVEEAPPNLEVSAVKIQRCYRAHRARMKARHLAELYREIRSDTDLEIRHLPFAGEASRRFKLVRPSLPRSRDDFDTLRNLLDRWRDAEIRRVARSSFHGAKLAAHGLILLKEVELLRTIDALRSRVKRDNEERANADFLRKPSRPLIWRGRNGETITVETPEVRRAREYREVYEALRSEELSARDRTALLLRLKRFAEPHSCSPAADLVYLADQELDLLQRVADLGMTSQLRNRLSLAFLRFARDTGIRVDDRAASDARRGTREAGDEPERGGELCKSCGRLLPVAGFPLERADGRRLPFCGNCRSLKPERGPRVVCEPYERMLRAVRRSEARLRCHASVAHVISSEVVRRLVDKIWHGRSGISQCDDLDRLRLVRFRRQVEWAPWNSLVLTRREAALHSSIEDPRAVYHPRLLRDWVAKNLQATVYFESLARLRGKLYRPTA